MGQDGTNQPSGDANRAWGAFGYLVSGPLVYGGLGWLLDHYLETSFLFPAGLLLGIAAGMYLLFKRYGHTDRPTGGSSDGDS